MEAKISESEFRQLGIFAILGVILFFLGGILVWGGVAKGGGNCGEQLANTTATLNACVNATNQLIEPVIMADGYGHFACCSKVGQCKSVPSFILNATNQSGGD